MATYYTIHDFAHPNNKQTARLVAICYNEDQAFDCYNRILNSGMGMTYIVLERIDTNNLGLIVGRLVLAEGWVGYP